MMMDEDDPILKPLLPTSTTVIEVVVSINPCYILLDTVANFFTFIATNNPYLLRFFGVEK